MSPKMCTVSTPDRSALLTADPSFSLEGARIVTGADNRKRRQVRLGPNIAAVLVVPDQPAPHVRQLKAVPNIFETESFRRVHDRRVLSRLERLHCPLIVCYRASMTGLVPTWAGK